MTCNRWLSVSLLTLLIACGGDDGGDDTGNDTGTVTASGDERPASDDFAPMDSESGVTNDGGSTTAADSTGVDGSSGAADSTGGSACVGAGQACQPNDFCNVWICTCNSGTTEFMTVGSCEDGVCSLDGTAACEPICMAGGGVASAVDGGCG